MQLSCLSAVLRAFRLRAERCKCPNIRYNATHQYSKAAEIFWLPISAVRDPPFLNWLRSPF